MSTLDHNFNDIAARTAKTEAQAPKYPPPFSIRLTFEERARLNADRGRVSLHEGDFALFLAAVCLLFCFGDGVGIDHGIAEWVGHGGCSNGLTEAETADARGETERAAA